MPCCRMEGDDLLADVDFSDLNLAGFDEDIETLLCDDSSKPKFKRSPMKSLDSLVSNMQHSTFSNFFSEHVSTSPVSSPMVVTLCITLIRSSDAARNVANPMVRLSPQPTTIQALDKLLESSITLFSDTSKSFTSTVADMSIPHQSAVVALDIPASVSKDSDLRMLSPSTTQTLSELVIPTPNSVFSGAAVNVRPFSHFGDDSTTETSFDFASISQTLVHDVLIDNGAPATLNTSPNFHFGSGNIELLDKDAKIAHSVICVEPADSSRSFLNSYFNSCAGATLDVDFPHLAISELTTPNIVTSTTSVRLSPHSATIQPDSLIKPSSNTSSSLKSITQIVSSMPVQQQPYVPNAVLAFSVRARVSMDSDLSLMSPSTIHDGFQPALALGELVARTQDLALCGATVTVRPFSYFGDDSPTDTSFDFALPPDGFGNCATAISDRIDAVTTSSNNYFGSTFKPSGIATVESKSTNCAPITDSSNSFIDSYFHSSAVATSDAEFSMAGFRERSIKPSGTACDTVSNTIFTDTDTPYTFGSYFESSSTAAEEDDFFGSQLTVPTVDVSTYDTYFAQQPPETQSSANANQCMPQKPHYYEPTEHALYDNSIGDACIAQHNELSPVVPILSHPFQSDCLSPSLESFSAADLDAVSCLYHPALDGSLYHPLPIFSHTEQQFQLSQQSESIVQHSLPITEPSKALSQPTLELPGQKISVADASTSDFDVLHVSDTVLQQTQLPSDLDFFDSLVSDNRLVATKEMPPFFDQHESALLHVQSPPLTTHVSAMAPTMPSFLQRSTSAPIATKFAPFVPLLPQLPEPPLPMSIIHTQQHADVINYQLTATTVGATHMQYDFDPCPLSDVPIEASFSTSHKISTESESAQLTVTGGCTFPLVNSTRGFPRPTVDRVLGQPSVLPVHNAAARFSSLPLGSAVPRVLPGMAVPTAVQTTRYLPVPLPLVAPPTIGQMSYHTPQVQSSDTNFASAMELTRQFDSQQVRVHSAQYNQSIPQQHTTSSFYPTSSPHVIFQQPNHIPAHPNLHPIVSTMTGHAPEFSAVNSNTNFTAVIPVAVFRPRPAHPLCCFGFGGRVLLMFPERRRRLNLRDTSGGSVNGDRNRSDSLPAVDDGPLRPGWIRLKRLNDLLKGTRLLRQLIAFPGPLHLKTDQSEIVRFIDSSAADLVAHPFEEAGGNSHGAVSGGNATRLSVTADADQSSANALLLWRLLKVLCLCRGGAAGGTAKSGCEPGKTSATAALRDESLENAIVALLVSSEAQPTHHSYLHPTYDTAATASKQISLPRPSISDQHRESALSRIQHLLLTGQREDACRVAVEQQLWAHALLLASHQDVTTYRNIVSSFALSQLVDGAPLQSLYLLFAGHPAQLFRAFAGQQQPTDTAGIVDEWRKNLAMFVANPTPNSQLVILQLGDLLLSRFGQVEAAHCCYLAADESLDIAASGRMGLVGVCHRRQPRTCLTSAMALQQSELYEYAKISQLSCASSAVVSASAASNAFASNSVSTGLLYATGAIARFAYACLLTDFGECDRALLYAERLVVSLASIDRKRARPLVSDSLVEAAIALETRLRQLLGTQRSTSLSTKMVSGISSIFESGVSYLLGSGATSPSASSEASNDTRAGISKQPPSISDKTAQSSEPRSTQPVAIGAVAVTAPTVKSETSEVGSGVAGYLKGLLGIKSVRQAILVQENEFTYDPVKKRWVCKTSPEAEDDELPNLPPPPAANITSRPQPSAILDNSRLSIQPNNSAIQQQVTPLPLPQSQTAQPRSAAQFSLSLPVHHKVDSIDSTAVPPSTANIGLPVRNVQVAVQGTNRFAANTKAVFSRYAPLPVGIVETTVNSVSVMDTNFHDPAFPVSTAAGTPGDSRSADFTSSSASKNEVTLIQPVFKARTGYSGRVFVPKEILTASTAH